MQLVPGSAQVLLMQQTWPAPPQAAHLVVVPLVAQARPTSHVLLQHASSCRPHGQRPP
jgi:hypothetical protein